MGRLDEVLSQRKCEELTPEEADALFFPGPGGKPHRADAYCSDCPFIRQCLVEAIEFDLSGFYAGTTEAARRQMRKLHYMSINVTPLVMFLPPEPDRSKRVVYLKVFTANDPHEWLDEDLEPTPKELLNLPTAM